MTELIPVYLASSFFWFVTFIACAGTILGCGGKWWWGFEYASHFRVQWFALLAAAMLVLLVVQRYKQAALIAALAAVNLSTIVPFYVRVRPGPSTATAHDARPLRVVSINVHAKNSQHEKIMMLVRETTPDFLTLFEVDESWRGVAQALRQQFAYAHIALRPGHFGLAFFSRYPMAWTELKEFGSISIYAIVARLNVNKRPLTIIGVHVLAPLNRPYLKLRNNHLADLARTARVQSGPVMLVGDLNITPWSPYFYDLLRDSALIDSRKGFGLQPTWPVHFPPLYIPIDHCLISPHIAIHNWMRGPAVGSDHLPILIDFSLDLSR